MRQVIRPTFGEADMESRRWLVEKFEEAGLEATIDGVATVFGRSPQPGPALLRGSHSDSQPRGGWLDGPLGVIFALEAARALAEDPATADLAVDIASFSDEEGSWLGALGSRSFADAEGDWEALQAQIPKAHGIAEVTPGDSLSAAMERAGVVGLPRVTCEPGRYLGFFEAHIEQGAKLEQSGKKIGVVHTIVGSHSYNITITGQQAIATGSDAVKLPLLKTVVGENAESTLLIYRSNELQVSIEGPDPLTDDQIVATTNQAPEEFVGRFRVLPEQEAEDP